MRRTVAFVIAVLGFGALGAAAHGQMGPMRRPGLWETHMHAEGRRDEAFGMRMCVDPSVDRQRGVFSNPMGGGRPGAGAENCSEHSFHPIAGGMAFHSVCRSGAAVTITDGTSTGDYQSHYHMDVTTRRTPGGVNHMTMDSRWLGPCAPGQRPGETSMVLPNGQVMRMGAGMGAGMGMRP
jgi:hypothetical protein